MVSDKESLKEPAKQVTSGKTVEQAAEARPVHLPTFHRVLLENNKRSEIEILSIIDTIMTFFHR
jgi:hypothetical protein